MAALWLGLNEWPGNECVPTLVDSRGIVKITFFVWMLAKEGRDSGWEDYGRFEEKHPIIKALIISALCVKWEELPTFTFFTVDKS